MRRSVTAALALLVAACSGGTGDNEDRIESQSSVLSEVRQSVQINRQNRDQSLPPVTRAQLDQLTVSALEVVIETGGRSAYLAPYSTRTDTLPGQIVVWRSPDGAQIVLRDGLIIGTRALGNDLASADVSQSLHLLRTSGTGAAHRVFYVREDDNTQATINAQCQVSSLGPAQIEIVERSFSTVRMREVCSVGSDQIINEYWIDSGDRTVLQSRQWVGPRIGFLDLRVLKK
ncbi:MAG: YjbF family lipoprotein [Pseudomonadota bacterium]